MEAGTRSRAVSRAEWSKPGSALRSSRKLRREGDLGDDETATHELAAPAGTRLAGALLERLDVTRAQRLPHRCETERESGEQCHPHREEHDLSVQRRLEGRGQQIGKRGGEPLDPHPPEGEPNDRAHRQHQTTLGEELTCDPASPGPQHGAQSDLTTPILSACQQEVRDVRAGDQQHEEDRPLQEPVEDLRPRVRNVEAGVEDVGRPVPLDFRVLERERRGDRFDLGLHLIHGRPVGHPTDGEDIPPIAWASRRALRQRQPDVGDREHERELGR